MSGAVAVLGFAVWSAVPVRTLPPPAVVRVCGENNNGVWARRQDVVATVAMLEQQGCFRSDIRFYRIDHEWTFVYGTRLLVGEAAK
jgi:hypothetical protein